MTTNEKLAQLESLLKITDTTLETEMTVFLDLAKAEILGWLYGGNIPADVTDVPAQYETVQIMACVVGYSQSGADGQTSHSENGISRVWKYDGMIAYIRAHVTAYAQVI